MQSLGDILRMQDSYAEATEKLEMAQRTFLSIGDQQAAASCMLSLGDILSMQDKYAAASEKVQKAQEIFDKIGFRSGVEECQAIISFYKSKTCRKKSYSSRGMHTNHYL